MSNSNPKTSHLITTQWKPGQSGNPKGKPEGSIHISTHISRMLEDENFRFKLRNGEIYSGAPVKAMITTIIIRALNGDLKAAELLIRYGYKANDVNLSESVPTPILANIKMELDS